MCLKTQYFNESKSMTINYGYQYFYWINIHKSMHFNWIINDCSISKSSLMFFVIPLFIGKTNQAKRNYLVRSSHMNSDSRGKGNFSNIMSLKHACVNSNNCPNKQATLSNKETSNQFSKWFQILDRFWNNEVWFIYWNTS